MAKLLVAFVILGCSYVFFPSHCFAQDDKAEAAGEASPGANDSEDSDMTLQDFVVVEGPTRDWRAPDFSKQENALGYTPETFQVPKELETRVNFWKMIYTEVSSQQGVLHDKNNLEIVYRTLDFSDLYNKNLNIYQIERERRKRVKAEKRTIEAMLRKLSKAKSAEGLTEEETRIYKLFEPIDEKNKFFNAATRRRIRFQLGQKDFIFKGLYSSGRYLESMEEIFRAEGLPVELTRLPFVESSFNLQARSRVGASGIWQLMPRTVRRFMKVGWQVDDRNDPLLATKGAARIFRENFVMLPSWPLAVTAYNQGPYGIKRRLTMYKATSLPDLIARDRTHQFGFAGENFFSSFLAVLSIEREAPKYFKNVRWAQRLEFDEMPLPKPLRFNQLTEFFGGSSVAIFDYNPHLSKRMQSSRASFPRNILIRLPKGTKDVVVAKITGKKIETPVTVASGTSAATVTAVPAANAATAKPDAKTDAKPDSKPDTKVEAKADSKKTDSKTDNKTDSKASTTADQPKVAEKVVMPDEPKEEAYKISRGDTLSEIAENFGVSVQAILNANKQLKPNRLREGQIITIPKPTAN